MEREWGAGPGLGGLEGKVGLVPEPSGQVHGPALRARLPEAYPTCPLQSRTQWAASQATVREGVVAPPGLDSCRGTGSRAWQGSGCPGEELRLRKGLGGLGSS